MTPSGFVVLAGLVLGVVAARGATASSPVDYTQRNATFSPTPTITPAKQSPQPHPTLQDKRAPAVGTIEKPVSPLGERRSAIDVVEAQEKRVQPKQSHRPEASQQPVNAMNQRRAAISTADTTVKPPVVAKYQDKLAAASAANMARFPAMQEATTAKINRFVFRRNPPEPGIANGGAAVTPAAGGSAVQK